MTTKELVEDFYTTFKGNKFEASFCKLKDMGGKVAPYFMEDWLEDKIKELETSIRKDERDECEKRLKDGVYEKLIRKEVVDSLDGWYDTMTGNFIDRLITKKIGEGQFEHTTLLNLLSKGIDIK